MIVNIPWKDALHQTDDIAGCKNTNEAVVVLKMEPSFFLLHTELDCWCYENETTTKMTTARFTMKLKRPVIDWEPSDH